MIFKVALFAERDGYKLSKCIFNSSKIAFDSEQLDFNLKVWTKPKI
jgi:hypothetical protein